MNAVQVKSGNSLNVILQTCAQLEELNIAGCIGMETELNWPIVQPLAVP